MTEGDTSGKEVSFKVHLRDYNEAMVSAWEDKEAFGEETFKDLIEVTNATPT
jgi:hypothetical protein